MAYKKQDYFNSETFKCPVQERDVSDKMRSFYKERELIDIVLIAEIDNIKVHAHKILLSASSEYFRGMFLSGMKEAKADEIKLKEVDGKTLESIVEFMYTASIELDNVTVENVLSAADRFQMYKLVSLCSRFMSRRIDDDNCLGIALFAEQHNAIGLCKRATKYALKHFETVCMEKEFFDLNMEQLIALISSDYLCVSAEENVFLSLVAWVEYDKGNREPLMFDIFKYIRFTSLKRTFISEIIENRHSVCTTIEYYDLICSWLKWHSSPKSRSAYPIESVKPRKIEKIVLITGNDTNRLKVHIFDRDSNIWSIAHLLGPSKIRKNYGSIAINGNLIIAGGKIGGRETNTVECYDFETNKWTELPPMGSARIFPGMAEIDGDLYVLAGTTDYKWAPSVDKYDFTTGKWKEVAPLLTPYEDTQVAVLDGLLYVAGTDDPNMECYDPATNQWIKKKCKTEISAHFGFAGASGYLYAVGGEYNEESLTTVERYDPSTDTWTQMSSLRVGQDYTLCVPLNKRLIACGGNDGQTYLELFDEYNPQTDEWTSLAPLAPHELCWCRSTLFAMNI